MTDYEINNLINLLIRFSAVLMIVFNLGIMMILLRQISIMNKVIKGIKRELVTMMALILLLLSGIALLYSILI